MGGTAPFVFQWNTGATAPALQNLGAGSYAVTVTDANGCTAAASAILTAPPPVIATAASEDVDCFTPGAILIEAIEGGAAPYTVLAMGQQFYTDGLEEVIVENVPPGAYAIAITDANGCTATETVALTGPGPSTESVVQESEVGLGDTVRLQVPAGFAAGSISWSPAAGLSCAHCPDPWTVATHNAVYTATIHGYGGCRVEVVHRVRVRADVDKTPYYIPNAIKPGAFGNEVFTVYAGVDLVNIRFLRVFTRWGEFVTEIENFPPNGPLGWNGEFDGKPVDPGVFVWYAELEFADGTTELVKGDVTVVR
jgi:hypothetical protein